MYLSFHIYTISRWSKRITHMYTRKFNSSAIFWKVSHTFLVQILYSIYIDFLLFNRLQHFPLPSMMYTVSFETTEVKFYLDYMESQFIIYSHYKISYTKLSMHPYLLILKDTLIYSNFSDWANFHYEQPYFLFCTDCIASNYTFLNWSFTDVKRIWWKNVLSMEMWLGQSSASMEHALAMGKKRLAWDQFCFSVKAGMSWGKLI